MQMNVPIGLPGRTSREVLLMWMLGLAAGLSLAGQTYFVSGTGDDANDGLTEAAPFATLAKAVATANADPAAEAVVVLDDLVQTAPVELTGAYLLRGPDEASRSTTIEADGVVTPLVKVSHPGAVVAHLTLSGGTATQTSGGNLWLNGGGTVTNCLIRDAIGKNGYGGGVRNDGGLVTHCVIEGGSLAGDSRGVGVYQTGAESVTEDSIIRNNRMNSLYGGGGIAVSDGVVRHCVISNNLSKNGIGQSGNGGGVYMENATLHHCLVAYNRAGSVGGGLYVLGRTRNVISNCTIVCNEARDQAPALSIDPNGPAEIVNTIIWGNRSSFRKSGDLEYGTSRLTKWRKTLVADPIGADPVSGDVAFRDAPGGDFRLSAFSAAVGAGSDGSDLGYEPLGHSSLEVGLASLPGKPLPPGEHPFLAASSGSAGAVTYRWRLDDLDKGLRGTWGDYTAETNHSMVLVPGRSRVVVEAKDEAGTTASFSRSFRVGARRLFLVPAGTPGNVPVAPYATKETAANDIQEAVLYCADGTELIVSDGDYGVARELYVPAKALIRSENGPEKTSIYRIGGFGKGTSTRVVRLDGKGAVLSGFAVTNGFYESDAVAMFGSNVFLDRDDVVTNCIIAQGKCPNGQFGSTAIAAMGGKIHDTIIRENSGGGGFGWAVCLYGPGAHMADCVVSNHFNGHHYYACGLGVWAKKALIERCVIRDNRNCPNGGGGGEAGGLYLEDSEIRDSLICENDAGTHGGGGIAAYMKSRIINCTIADNTATKGGGLKIEDSHWGKGEVVVINTLFHGNVSYQPTDSPGEPSWVKLDGPGCSASHIAVPDSSAVLGEGSFVMALGPRFVDESHGDYRLDIPSPCRDAGTNGERLPSEVDVAGNPRIVYGTIDIGAYEFQGAERLTCDFTVDGYQTAGAEVTATAVADGPDLNGLEYRWQAHDILRGSSSPWTRWENDPVAFLDLPPGRFVFTLQVRNGSGAQAEKIGETIYSVVAKEVRLVPPEAAHGDPVYPYDSWEHAATNLPMALSAAGNGSTILATNGCYGLTSGVVLDHRIALMSVEGPRKTSIYRAYPRRSGQPVFRPVTMRAPGAVLAGFTVSNSIVLGDCFAGAAIYCEDGIVSNCIASFNTLHAASYGAAIKNINGLVTRCLVHDNANGGGDGFGISQRGVKARTEGCVIFNNDHWSGNYCRGALVIEGGVASRCVVTNNANGAPNGENTAGVFLTGGTLRDSLVAWNQDPCNTGGVFARDGALVNCTIVSNRTEGLAASNGGGIAFRARNENRVGVTNCIVYGNWNAKADGTALNSSAASIDSRSAGRVTLSHSLLGNWEGIDPDAVGCLAGDPLFNDFDGGDWRLAKGSPCRDAGVTLDFMHGGHDLDGRPRVVHRDLVDLGCYEADYVTSHTILMLR